MALLTRQFLPGVHCDRLPDGARGRMLVLADGQHRCYETTGSGGGGGAQHAIVYAHGNEVCAEQIARTMDRLAETLGWVVLAIEYPGYGPDRARQPSTRLCEEAGEAVLAHATEHLGLQEGNVVLVGRSIGTGLAAQLAARHPRVGALVLISPYTSLSDLAAYTGGRMAAGLGLLARVASWGSGWNTRQAVQQCTMPLAVVHGEADTVIPPEQGRQVVEAARAGGIDRLVMMYSVPDTGHNGPAMFRDLLSGQVVWSLGFDPPPPPPPEDPATPDDPLVVNA